MDGEIVTNLFMTSYGIVLEVLSRLVNAKVDPLAHSIMTQSKFSTQRVPASSRVYKDLIGWRTMVLLSSVTISHEDTTGETMGARNWKKEIHHWQSLIVKPYLPLNITVWTQQAKQLIYHLQTETRTAVRHVHQHQPI